MDESKELVTVSVNVPRGRLGDLYRHVAALNEDGPPPTEQTAAPTGVRPWEAGDTAVAKQLYDLVSDNAKHILDVLMELGDAGSIGGTELAKEAGIDKGAYGVAGSLSSVGKAATKVGRALPYRAQANPVGGPGIYGMEQTVSELFRAVRASKGGQRP